MNPLEAAVLVCVLVLPLHALVLWQLGRLEDPAYLREHGIVVVHERALQMRADPVGRYGDRCIWGTVTFMGMQYRYDRIARPREKERIGRGELYVEPGIIYVTD